MNFGYWAGRLRLPLGFVLAALYIVFARPTMASLLVGGGVALLGVLVRAWAAGHIFKNDKLATTGPYAHTRNPLYFGSFLIAAGFAIAAHWALLALVAAFWMVIYGPTIKRERDKIAALFPAEFPAFERNVPAFFPRLTAWKGEGEGVAGGESPSRGGSGSGDGSFSSSLYMKHGEWRAALGYLGAMIWLTIRARGIL